MSSILLFRPWSSRQVNALPLTGSNRLISVAVSTNDRRLDCKALALFRPRGFRYRPMRATSGSLRGPALGSGKSTSSGSTDKDNRTLFACVTGDARLAPDVIRLIKTTDRWTPGAGRAAV